MCAIDGKAHSSCVQVASPHHTLGLAASLRPPSLCLFFFFFFFFLFFFFFFVCLFMPARVRKMHRALPDPVLFLFLFLFLFFLPSGRRHGGSVNLPLLTIAISMLLLFIMFTLTYFPFFLFFSLHGQRELWTLKQGKKKKKKPHVSCKIAIIAESTEYVFSPILDSSIHRGVPASWLFALTCVRTCINTSSSCLAGLALDWTLASYSLRLAPRPRPNFEPAHVDGQICLGCQAR